RRSAGHREHARERDHGLRGSALLPRAAGRTPPDRLPRDGLPFGHLSLPGPEGDRPRARGREGRARSHGLDRAPAGRDRRAHARGLPLPRALPQLLHHGRGPGGRARSSDGRPRRARHLPVRRRHPRGRDRARRRLRGGRLPQVAVRGTGQRVPLHAARDPEDGAAPSHGLGGPSQPVRVRSRTARAARRRDAHDERHARHSGLLRGPGRARHRARGGRPPDPREIEADDRAPARARRRAGLHAHRLARSRAPRGHRRLQPARGRPGRPGLEGPRLPRGLPRGRGGPRVAALLQHVRGAGPPDGGDRAHREDARLRLERALHLARHLGADVTDYRSHPSLTRESGLLRQLAARHQVMLAIGGAIGTGLFLGSGLSVGTAGPAVLLSYVLMALVSIALALALAEMCVAHPTAGSFGVYAGMYLSPFAGYAVRVTYWIMEVVATGGHMVAVSIYMQYWFPQ